MRFMFVLILNILFIFDRCLGVVGHHNEQNLVMFIDSTELSWIKDNEQINLSKMFSENDLISSTCNLIIALNEEQTIICTKSLWRNLHYIYQIYDDFIRLYHSAFIDKYKNKCCIVGPDRKLITVNEKMLLECKFLFEKCYSVLQIDDYLSIDNFNMLDLVLKNNSFNFSPSRMYQIYSLYRLFQKFISKYQYVCFDINKKFLIFVPDNKIKNINSVDQNEPLWKISQKLNIPYIDVAFGLLISKFKQYNFMDQRFLDSEYQEDRDLFLDIAKNLNLFDVIDLSKIFFTEQHVLAKYRNFFQI